MTHGETENHNAFTAIDRSDESSIVLEEVVNNFVIEPTVPPNPTVIINMTSIPSRVIPLDDLPATIASGSNITPRLEAVIPQTKLNTDNADFFII